MSAYAKLLPLLALAACHSATDVTPRLDVSLSLSPMTAVRGTVVDVAVTVINRDARAALTADPRSYGCRAPYDVTDASGRTVGLPGRICIAIAYGLIELAPGASIVIRDQWALDATDGAGGARKVDIGPYRMRARVQGASRELVSDPVTVTVIP